MRSRLFGSGLFLVFSVSLTAFVLFLCASGVQAATYSWDPGTGTWTWDTTTYSNWYDSGSSSDILWPNLNTSVAEFGAGVPTPGRGTITGGAVLVAPGGVTANAMTFDITGYTLTGSTITLAGVAPTITVTTAGTTATIGDVIDGAAGLAKAGAGTLTLNGVNIYTGGTRSRAFCWPATTRP
jgi:fibronectin-binding autotransporter adhesin